MGEEITVYELIGLIKDGKAPKEIDYLGDKYVFNKDMQTYGLFDDYNWQFILNGKVTIYKEKEWKEIYTLDNPEEDLFMNRQNGMTKEDRKLLDSNFEVLSKTINKLIENQRKIIEMLEDK